MKADLVVRGGDVVLEGAAVRADVAVTGGVVTAITREPVDAATVVDATGCLVLPGGVDAHVHLSGGGGPEGAPTWADDWESGTRAAAAGGVTTVGNMTVPREGESLTDAVRRVGADVAAQSLVDVLLHPVVAGEQHLDPAQLAVLRELGQTSIKVFTVIDAYSAHRQRFYAFMAEAGRQGFLTVVHCEDAELIGWSTAHLAEQGRADFRAYGESRPDTAEEAAVAQLIAFAETSGTPVYVVHLSSARALAACAAARSRGVPVYVETRPLYLHLTEELLQAEDGAKYIGQPPLRRAADVDALWAGLRFGTVDTVATDHAPWTLAEKLAAGDQLDELRPGVADLETVRPMLFSAGVLTGRISLARFVELTATNPARLFGVYPRKGVIAPGSDADLVVWDPAETRVVDGSRMQSRAGYSPYDGTVVTGWPREVLSRGELVVSGGAVVAGPGRGQLLQRGLTAPR
ncbi:putative D-phenylhydantoinase [Modestobacter italicus]|uniref:D-hydantoinase n=1 Tax=Modestobacter italicus (strain DSM 44449 / CECT 9708 / BC 501) TaxID=2732864 RepID=I4F1S5_MODI5|nr:amidohydrolase family protein [Modestobacter marinus]CCH89588.1 putative D-phenylhydantoinase [Modestobacter marinus]